MNLTLKKTINVDQWIIILLMIMMQKIKTNLSITIKKTIKRFNSLSKRIKVC